MLKKLQKKLMMCKGSPLAIKQIVKHFKKMHHSHMQFILDIFIDVHLNFLISN